MKKKNGFTLVELLAVIVILAIILVIAVPQIMNTIDSAREGSMQSSVKMIAASAEREYTVRETLGTLNQEEYPIACTDVASLSDADYVTCEITFSNGEATVKLLGKSGGKFAGKAVCAGTRTTATISADCPTP